LLVAQTALCMLMLAAAGLFLQTLRRATTLDLGFDADRLVSFQLFRIDPNVADEALERIRALPGVVQVSKSGLDFRGGGTFSHVRFGNGDTVPALLSPTGGFVDTAYASAVGLRLVAGRFFSREDVAGSEPVAVINQAMADAYWHQRSPVGDCFRVGAATQPCRRIVGIVGSVRWDMTAAPPQSFYMPAAQSPVPRCCPMIAVRTRNRANAASVAEIRQITSTIAGQNREYPPNPRLATERLEPQLRPWRIAAAAFLLCGALALAAAAAGIYGLVGYEVTQRTHELGVRITIGATPGDILTLVLTSGVRIVGIGVLVGAVIAVMSGRLISSLLFETSPYDVPVLVTTALALTAVALLASLVPAWRATRVDPMVALKAE
jgi:predicted permease